jgi:hypothetical protein
MWPWSTIKHLRRELHKAQLQTFACGYVAHGVYAGLTTDMHSESLVAVMALQKKLENAEATLAAMGWTKLP